MAIEIEKFIKDKLRQLPLDHPDRGFLERQAQTLTDFNAKATLSQKREVVLTNPNLEAEWTRQAQKFVELGFHKELCLSEPEYLASLPKFEPQPENFRGRFDIPVLVETRIAPSRQSKLAGLPYFLDDLRVSDWRDDPRGYKTPDAPYTTWMYDGKKYLGKSVKDVRRALAIDERGATIYDGIALWIANPSVLDNHGIDLPGTSVGSGHAPYLDRWLGAPRVRYRLVGRAHSGFGSASCGRIAA